MKPFDPTAHSNPIVRFTTQFIRNPYFRRGVLADLLLEDRLSQHDREQRAPGAAEDISGPAPDAVVLPHPLNDVVGDESVEEIGEEGPADPALRQAAGVEAVDEVLDELTARKLPERSNVGLVGELGFHFAEGKAHTQGRISASLGDHYKNGGRWRGRTPISC